MSETMEIPDGKTVFKLPSGQTFRLSQIDAMRNYNRIVEECKTAGTGNFEHLERFAAWIKQEANADLNPDQADYLIDRIQCEYAKAKNAVRALLNSPSSTEPPSAS